MSNSPDDFDLEFDEATGGDVPAATEAPAKTPDDVPDKYKGKSIEDLISMHANAEKALSRQGRDLAEQRRLTDEILRLKGSDEKLKENEPKPVTPDELFNDPNKAVVRVLEQSPVAEKVNRTEERIDALERSLGQSDFETKFSTFKDDVQDPEFQKWVSSNKARARLLADLHYNYNFEAGSDLWEMWDEHKKLAGQQRAETRKEKVKAGKTITATPSNPSGNVKVYSRAKLLDLQVKAEQGDPAAVAKWNDPGFQSEYQRAYQEGRVK